MTVPFMALAPNGDSAIKTNLGITLSQREHPLFASSVAILKLDPNDPRSSMALPIEYKCNQMNLANILWTHLWILEASTAAQHLRVTPKFLGKIITTRTTITITITITIQIIMMADMWSKFTTMKKQEQEISHMYDLSLSKRWTNRQWTC